jgi:hypothetical protein
VTAERKFSCRLKQSFDFKQKKPTLQVNHPKDGKTYYVFTELSPNENTRAAHPDAYCRQYWLQKKEDTPMCLLLDRTGEVLSEEFYVEFSDGRLEALSVFK